MPSWIPGPYGPQGEVDWEAYKRKVGSIAETPHQAAIAETPTRKRTTREVRTDG